MNLHPTAWVAPSADVMGDVTLGEDASVWYQCVLRGDIAPIVLGPRSNLQDLTMVHVDEGVPCTIGADVGVGHRCILHGCTIEDGCLIGMNALILHDLAYAGYKRAYGSLARAWKDGFGALPPSLSRFPGFGAE